MVFIDVIPPRKATGELAEAYRYMREVGETRLIPNVLRVSSQKPGAVRRFVRLWELSAWSGDEPRALREFLASAVSRLNECHYCTDAHESMMEAAGGNRNRAAAILDGRARDATPLELALVDLARKAQEAPKHLSPSDLDGLRAIVGDGALDYAYTLASFHFANRMADLLDINAEALPDALRRFEPLRQLVNKAATALFRKAMDLGIRPYTTSYEEALSSIAPVFERVLGRPLKEEFEPVRARPKIIEAVQLMLEERESAVVDGKVLAKIHRVVEEALPATAEDTRGIHPRPGDPVEAFVFVGTRYADRTTRPMIDALRHAGFDEPAVLDIALAVAHANQWARLHRLTGLPAAIGYLAG